ncbi:hypothetical protein [Bradyrhizobium mercantei]|uniref:hypothetical protein n=1 Tax=Bradyrhizobium mercantei TaxID=1904807 RepID=UPI0011777943|nr:hypothetical protein [Bradyrhizobium mercantei]
MSKSLLRPRKARNDDAFRQIRPNPPHGLCSDLNALMQKNRYENQSADHVTVAALLGHRDLRGVHRKICARGEHLLSQAVPAQPSLHDIATPTRRTRLAGAEKREDDPPTSKQ